MQHPLFMEEVRDDGVARLTLTRPEVHNAFNDKLIAELTQALKGLESDDRVRVVVLAAEGKSFSAGADLNWMKSMAGYTEQENLEDSRALAGLMRTLNDLTKPTVALVQGSAFGGGVGLVACCDIALCVESAKFALTEVKLGLIPSVISPYVVAAIGQRAARRYFLTGEPITSAEAAELGLVHKVVGFDDLERSGEEMVALLLKAGPEAQAAAKDLVFAVADRPVDDSLVEETAQRIARIRVGAEGQEGLSAFFEKRRPAWVLGEEEG